MSLPPTKVGRRALLVGPLALAACGQGGGVLGACPGKPIGEVPMVPVGSDWIVPVKINGQDRGMKLDTGAAQNVLSKVAADELGLHTYGEYEALLGGLSGYSRGSLVQIDHFGFAGIDLHGLLMPVTGIRVPEFDLLPVVGLLGMQNLWVFDLQFDFPGQTLRLYERAECDDPKPDWAGEYTQVAMHTVSSGRGGKAPDVDVLTASNHPNGPARSETAEMLLEATVNGHAFTALFDTGASKSYLNADAAALAGIGSGGQPAKLSDALGNAIETVRVPGNSIRVGTMTWSDVSLTVTSGRLEYGVDMLFGQDLMRGRRVWAMLKARRLFLQRA